jgi:hypothetical protein
MTFRLFLVFAAVCLVQGVVQKLRMRFSVPFVHVAVSVVWIISDQYKSRFSVHSVWYLDHSGKHVYHLLYC